MLDQNESQPALGGAHLRQRRAPLDSEAVDQRTQSASNQSDTKPSPRRRTTKIRINRLLGQLVPLVLLVYISTAYDLVVHRFAYGYLYRAQHKTLLPVLWLLPAHLVFLTSLKAYLKVFLAYAAEPDVRKESLLSKPFSRLRRTLGAQFPALPSSNDQDWNKDIQLCQANGEPIRCWRDDCNGRIKGVRTRHCGDCGTCRIGFDHHCPWFDNDVTLPATMRPFLYFLLSIPPLFFWCLGPLIPMALRHTKEIWLFAKSDHEVLTGWWNRWYSWCGGPIFRWAVGWIIAGRKIAKDPNLTSSVSLDRPSLLPPVIVGTGALFTTIASILAFSTIRNLVRGKFTVDVEREKSFYRASVSLKKAKADGKPASVLEQISRNLDLLAPDVHFLVPKSFLVAQPESSHVQDRIVKVSTLNDPFKEEIWIATLLYYLSNNSKVAKIDKNRGVNPRLRQDLIAKARHTEFHT